MKVKIKDAIYDSNEEPIMLILEDADKSNIGNMIEAATKYCSYPDHMGEKEIEDFMKI